MPNFGADVFDVYSGYLGWTWDPVTLYHLPHTVCWSNNLVLTVTQGGVPPSPTVVTLPTELWLPRVQSLNAESNQVGLSVSWAPGKTIVVEASANLANPDWLPVATNILADGHFYFCEPQRTNYSSRFYRIRSP